jgi:type IV secretion system protein VirD4
MKFKGIRLGHSPRSDEVLRYQRDGHLITVAPTRTGKGRDVIIPALLEWPYSCVVNDLKGELSCVTSAQRRRFGQVVYLDPYLLVDRLMKGARPSLYNPMAALNPGSNEFTARAEKISDGVNWDEGQTYKHFTEGSRELCTAVQMGLAAHAEPHEKNLNAVRSVITGEFQGGVDVFGFAQAIMQNSTNQALRQMVANFCIPGAQGSRSLADIIQTAKVQTRFLSNPALMQSLSASDFSFADLKKRVVTVYVVLPMDFVDVSGKYSRLIFNSALSELLACGTGGVRVLLLMDEFAQLGTLMSMQSAMSMAAGFGIQLWPILQDLNQLAGLYPQTWETFLSNAGVRMFFAPRDEKTSHYLSGQCGQTLRRVISKSISYQDEVERQERLRGNGMNASRAASINVNFGSAPGHLLLPHECRELGGDEMLLFVEGVNGVIRAKRRPYWDEPEFRGQYSKNPYFG